MFKKLSLLFIATLSATTFAVDDHLEIRLGYRAPAPRWQFENSKLPKNGYALSLYNIKKNYKSQQQAKCYNQALKALKQSQTARGWVAVYRFKCARETTSLKRLQWIKQSVKYLNGQPKLLLSGGHVSHLRQELVKGLIILARKNMSNLTLATKYLNQALEYRQRMEREDLAFVYELMGDVSLSRQKVSRAYFYYKSALEVQNQKSLRQKVDLAKRRLPPSEFEEFIPPEQKPIVDEHEKNIFNRFERAQKQGKKALAVEIGANYLKKYNRGFYHEEISIDIRKQLNDAFRKDQIKFFHKLLERAKVAPQYILSQWGDYFFDRVRSLPAYHLYKESLSHGKERGTFAKDLFRAAYSAYQIGEYNYAKDNFNEVIKTGSGSEFASTSWYYLGLTYLRLKKNKESIDAFEKYVSTGHDEFRLQSIYWGWRQLQSLKSKQADKWQHKLISEFSLTYYGLRAQLENGNKELIFVNHNNVPQKLVYWFSGYEKESWKRVKILLEAGWLQEANNELKTWSEPVTATEKLVMAHLYSLAMNHLDAILLTQEVFDKYPTWKRMETLELVYPQEFNSYINTFAKKHKIENHLIKGLIKQESSYLTFVSSPMGAMGLMQLMRPTAQEMNRLLRLGSLKIPDDLEQPKRNIRLGSYYLKRLINAFDGHIPLALASYNVGIGNLRKWQAQREETNSILKLDPKDPFSELWVDELAWSETSFYVKAILRNLIVYRWLDQGQVSTKLPVWTYAGKVQN